MPSHPCSTEDKMCTEEQEEDAGEQDDQVGEDDDEEEEDKGDGSTHATFVADLTETAKPQLQEILNEKPSRRTNPDNQARTTAKTKANAEATTQTGRRREGRRIPICHRQIRDQSALLPSKEDQATLQIAPTSRTIENRTTENAMKGR